MLDSGLVYMVTIPDLNTQGFFGTTVFKKKGFDWPKGSDEKNVLLHMQGKKVG